MDTKWDPPKDWLRVETFESHAAGEPLRVITKGFPPLPGKTILEKRRYAQEHWDAIRRALMWEPRGHADMYGAVLTEPERPDSHLGVLFLHNEGFSTMCGHGIIALTTVVFETGIVRPEGERPELKIDTPAGQVTAAALWEKGRVAEVSFRNVPSFVAHLDQEVSVEGFGPSPVDIAFGGAFYAFGRADFFGLRLVPEEFRRIIDVGMKVKKAVMSSPTLLVRHPFSPDLSFLYGTIFIGPAQDPSHHSRNVCVFADGEVDRSPTGTGVSARAALHYARGEVNTNEAFTVESLLGTCFAGRVVETLRFGPYEAVIPEVTGSASLTGRQEIFINPQDPLKNGFFLR